MAWEYDFNLDFDLSRDVDTGTTFGAKLKVRGTEQEATAKIILEHLKSYPGIVLGDEVGMGKTWIALLAAIPVALKRPVLVLTPSRLLSNQWKKQYLDLIKAKFLDRKNLKKSERLNSLIEVHDDFTSLVQAAKQNRKGLYLCSIGTIEVEKKYKCLENVKGLFELLVVDEGHNFKNEFTQRYQIFKKTRDDRSFKEPLNNQAHRILILTATPFQLGHAELKGVLNIFDSTCAPKELKERFQSDLALTLKSLDNYKERLGKFEHHFKSLTPPEYETFCNLLRGKPLHHQDSIPPLVSSLLDHFSKLKLLKEEVNQCLLKFLIRNNKDKAHRDELPKPISLPLEKQLLFFLTEQLSKVKRLHFSDKDGHMAAIESSYGRFQDHLNSMRPLSHKLLNHYLKLSEGLFQKFYINEVHPKLDDIVSQVFNNWLNGEKSLVFCFFTKTLDEFSEKIEARVRTHIESVKENLFASLDKNEQKELHAFRHNVGIANNMSSLVFRDNLFSLVLLPILQKHKLEPIDFLVASADERKEIVKYLQRIRFNPTSANFHKLVAAFTHHSFSKFYQEKRNFVPKERLADFEYLLDQDNLKKLFRTRAWNQSDSETDEGTPKELIEAYVKNLCDDTKRLLSIMSHQTVWEHHSDALLKLKIDVRIHLTDIIGAYLTSDEYLFFDLFPQFSGKRPDIDAIPAAYLKGHTQLGESTYSRVCRFLESASGMAQDNLETLASEMNHRYVMNKSKAEKVIVETVSGDVGWEAKIRTVTAFRTPLPPYILVSTSVLAEGVDLHTECRHVTHYDHEWNPAILEQKTGRIDRVGSKSERLAKAIEITHPYIKHTQDEKAYRVVMARKSWFDSIMGERYETKWVDGDCVDDSVFELPLEISEALRMRLDNGAHLMRILKTEN